MVVATEFLLYISFALLVGGLLSYVIPSEKMPQIDVPQKLLVFCAAAVPVFAFAPILRIFLILSEGRSELWVRFKSILFSFEIGKAWLFMLAVGILLVLLLAFNDLKKSAPLAQVACFLTLLLILAQGKAGHASTITAISGFVAHSLHFLAVMIWAGLLFTAGWFSHGKDWRSFLRWFTPLAVVCFIVLTAAGFWTMTIDINNYDHRSVSIWYEYKNSWLVDYGQALLIKHLLVIPLLVFAFLNGFLLKGRENARKIARIEGLVILLIFAVTGFMGQQYPPHQVQSLLAQGGPSPLFNAVYQGVIDPAMTVTLSFGWLSYILFAFALIFIGLMILSVRKNAAGLFSFLLGLLVVGSGYLGLMLGVHGIT
ncbi:MAG TPA: hypothetical protein VF149_02715 [Bacillales bacterium]